MLHNHGRRSLGESTQKDLIDSTGLFIIILCWIKGNQIHKIPTYSSKIGYNCNSAYNQW